MTRIRSIGTEVFLFEDKTGKWQIDDILQNDSLFKKSDITVPCYGVTNSTIWVKIPIKWNSNSSFQMAMGYPTLDHAIFYYPTEEGYKSKRSGENYPQHQRDAKAADLIFNIPPFAKEDTVVNYYLQTYGRIIILPLTIGKSDQIKDEVHRSSLFYLFYLGFVTMLFLYNLSIFITPREKEYFFYSTWVFFATLYFMVAKGYASLFFSSILGNYFTTFQYHIFSGGDKYIIIHDDYTKIKNLFPFHFKMVFWFDCRIYIDNIFVSIE